MQNPLFPRTKIEKRLATIGLLLFLQPVCYLGWIYFQKGKVDKAGFLFVFTTGFLGAALLGVAAGMEKGRLRKQAERQSLRPQEKSRWKEGFIKRN